MKLRKVQAQRKFAQGAAVLPHVSNVANERRTESHDKGAAPPTVLHNMSARALLDQVSFNGLHNHHHALQPIVRLERLQPERQRARRLYTPELPRPKSLMIGKIKKRTILKKKRLLSLLRPTRFVPKRKLRRSDDTDTEDETPLKFLAKANQQNKAVAVASTSGYVKAVRSKTRTPIVVASTSGYVTGVKPKPRNPVPPKRVPNKKPASPVKPASTSKPADAMVFYNQDKIEHWIKTSADATAKITNQFKVPLPPKTRSRSNASKGYEDREEPSTSKDKTESNPEALLTEDFAITEYLDESVPLPPKRRSRSSASTSKSYVDKDEPSTSKEKQELTSVLIIKEDEKIIEFVDEGISTSPVPTPTVPEPEASINDVLDQSAPCERVSSPALSTIAPSVCPSERYVTVQDVVRAPVEDKKSRCRTCPNCSRVAKVEMLSKVVQATTDGRDVYEFDETREGNDTNVKGFRSRRRNGLSEDSNYVYLDILPAPSNHVIQIKLTPVLNQKKPMMQARLMPKTSTASLNEYNLVEHEGLFEQLIETLDTRSLKKLTVVKPPDKQGPTAGPSRKSKDGQESNKSVQEPSNTSQAAKKPDQSVEVRNTPITPAETTSPNQKNESQKAQLPATNSNDSNATSPTNTSSDLPLIYRIDKNKRNMRDKAQAQSPKTATLASKAGIPKRQARPLTKAKNLRAVPGKSKLPKPVASSTPFAGSSKAIQNGSRSGVVTKGRLTRPMASPQTGPAPKANVSNASTSNGSGNHPSQEKTGAIVREAPVYYPTEEEFNDPVAYFEKIRPIASKYGICKVVAPASFKPKCNIHEKIRFTVANQYIARLYTRWGPACKEMCAIKAHLATQKVLFTRPPILDSIEVDLPKLYRTVQCLGGLRTVIEKKLWGRVAEHMRFARKPMLVKKLDEIYVTHLLPYDTLSSEEREEIRSQVYRSWHKKNEKIIQRMANPLHRQKQLLGESGSSTSDTEDDSNIANALLEAEDCIVAGRRMTLTNFTKVAKTIKEQYFPDSASPSPREVEDEYWRIVLLAAEHICVNTASIDTGEEGYGFAKNREEPYGDHPWNLKMISENPGNVLAMLGPVLGVTVPTLHLGMMFSTSCWHRDPHGLPWLEYMHSGPAKIWYGIPDDQSTAFRTAVERLCPTSCQNKSIWLPSDITMIPPNFLLSNNVSLTRVEQKPGEYIIVCPKAYSSSISTGYTQSESVYFATNSWLKSVDHVFQELRESCEPTMFSLEQLLISVAGDPRAPPSLLQLVHTTLATVVEDELQHRRELTRLGLVTSPAARTSDKPGAWSDECEVCRATLYLSKVTGLIERRASVCLKHALRLLTASKGKRDVTTLSLVVYFTQEQLRLVMLKLQNGICPQSTT